MSAPRLSDDYEIGEVLGVGTVGTIYRAVDRHTGQPVAIKKLHPSVSSDRLIRARFRREMLILDRIDHPHIVRYLGGGHEDQLLYYVMELVDGGTVKELLKATGPLPWPAVVEIARQLCSALQFAHNHGVIHRDVKPGNLLLTSDGEVKLGDFGIARDLEDADISSTGMTVGTHAYMAPEQIKGDTAVSGKADLYSLGCCLFEMLSGRTPFVGEGFTELLDQHLHLPAPEVQQLVPECPLALNAIIGQMLAKDPAERPFNVRQIQAVMLELEHPLAGPQASPATAVANTDLGSQRATDRGRGMLRQRIQRRISASSPQEVSWARLTLVFAVILAVIALAATLRS